MLLALIYIPRLQTLVLLPLLFSMAFVVASLDPEQLNALCLNHDDAMLKGNPNCKFASPRKV